MPLPDSPGPTPIPALKKDTRRSFLRRVGSFSPYQSGLPKKPEPAIVTHSATTTASEASEAEEGEGARSGNRTKGEGRLGELNG